MKKFPRMPLAITLGTTLLSGLTAANVHADTALSGENPFAMQELPSGYMLTAAAEAAKEGNAQPDAKAMQGACGEGKCGAKMTSGASGDAKDAHQSHQPENKAIEAKCASMKK